MNDTIDITCECPFCGKSYNITLPSKEYFEGVKKYQQGASIQDAFPNFTPSQREALKTGICDECWDNM